MIFCAPKVKIKDEARHRLIPQSRRLLVVGSVRRIIGGLYFREPLHADGVDLGDLVFEGSALDLILDLAITQDAFKGDELPLLEGLGELREIPPGDRRGAIRCDFRSRPCRSSSFPGLRC